MPYRHTLLFLLAMLTTIDASAWSRIADAHVHSVNGMPCFSITKKEEARNGTPMLGALIVSDLSVQPVKKVWSFSVPPDRPIPIHADSCIRYGDLPPTATGIKPKSLVPGHFYSAFLNGRPKDPSDPTYGYVAKFCLVQQVSAKLRLVVIQSDTQAWMDDTCPAKNPVP